MSAGSIDRQDQDIRQSVKIVDSRPLFFVQNRDLIMRFLTLTFATLVLTVSAVSNSHAVIERYDHVPIHSVLKPWKKEK